MGSIQKSGCGVRFFVTLVTVEEGARKSRREKEAATRSIRKELNVAEVRR